MRQPRRHDRNISGSMAGDENDRVKRITLLVLVALVLFLVVVPRGSAMETLRIGTGGSTGVYYPIGKAIANGLTKAGDSPSSPLHGRIAIAQNSAGSIENVRGVLAGDLEVGMVQADIAALAFGRQGDFAQLPAEGAIRALAALYAEKLQVVVRKDAGVTSFAGLRGKRFSLDEQGSGTRAIMNIALAAHDLKEEDLQPLYLKPAFTEDKMKSGQLQGFALMAGAPNAAVSKLAEVGVTLVPVAPEVAAVIHRSHPFLTPGTIAGDVYQGVAATPTLEVYALLVVNAAMPEELAHAVTEALLSEATGELLRQGHPLGKAINLDNALKGMSIPLHPGAERFYRQRRMVP